MKKNILYLMVAALSAWAGDDDNNHNNESFSSQDTTAESNPLISIEDFIHSLSNSIPSSNFIALPHQGLSLYDGMGLNNWGSDFNSYGDASYFNTDASDRVANLENDDPSCDANLIMELMTRLMQYFPTMGSHAEATINALVVMNWNETIRCLKKIQKKLNKFSHNFITQEAAEVPNAIHMAIIRAEMIQAQNIEQTHHEELTLPDEILPEEIEMIEAIALSLENMPEASVPVFDNNNEFTGNFHTTSETPAGAAPVYSTNGQTILIAYRLREGRVYIQEAPIETKNESEENEEDELLAQALALSLNDKTEINNTEGEPEITEEEFNKELKKTRTKRR